ncbi:hypothetical protein CLOM_g10684 [Closterium sp. NIES-68]|nr:hypothetical protein CLOM_g10684 [Closterium sp. NIES-68]GJP60033.1 hypothetical protein CLOP_g17176 [Closterium sp. NIES-67]
MGALLSCCDCCYPRGERPLTDAERQEVAHARGRAAQAAEERAARFESSAQGRAARTAMAAAAAKPQGPSREDEIAKEWSSG